MEPQNVDHFYTKPVKVRVTDPQHDTAKNFVTYLILGSDELGTFEIRRRFNDFYYLRETLKKRWPGLYIPPIPQKKITIVNKQQIDEQSKDENLTEYRRKFFEYFLIQLSTFHHLFYCTITQEFLRNKSIQMEKYYQTVPNPKTADLIKQYKQLFPNLHTQDQTELKNICLNFNAYLKKAQKELKGMTAEMNTIAEARSAFLENLNNCNTNILPEYEKNVYAEYYEGSSKQPMLLFLQDHKVQDNIRNLRDNTVGKPNSFGQLHDALLYEYREVEAFQEAIVSKQNIESNKKKLEQKCLSSQSEISKLMGGKFSLKSLISKGSKNQQIKVLQKEIPQMQKEVQELGQLCDIVNAVMAQIQIVKFKKMKQQQYYRNLSEIGKSELEFLGSYGDLMKSVMDGLNRSIKV